MSNKNKLKKFVCIMPMAGAGVRFSKYGYTVPKPLIEIQKTPMYIKASKTFPISFKRIFIVNKKINREKSFIKSIKSFKRKKVISLSRKTLGQASTVYKSLKFINNNDSIIVHSCDLSFDLKLNLLQKKLSKYDILVFTSKASSYHVKNHNQYSWVKKNDNDIFDISLKKNFKKSKGSKVLIGSFVFKNKKILKDVFKYIFDKKIKINKEYYVDAAISIANKIGYKLSEIIVKNYKSWGSHNELANYKSKIKK